MIILATTILNSLLRVLPLPALKVPRRVRVRLSRKRNEAMSCETLREKSESLTNEEVNDKLEGFSPPRNILILSKNTGGIP